MALLSNLYVILILRILHIGAGIMWVGSATLYLLLIIPAARSAQSAGQKFLQTLGPKFGTMMGLVTAASALVMGIANGYANINLITWLQQKVAPEMTGRVMSLVMFAAVGLNPISTALAGALIGLNLTVLLVCAGLLMTAFTLSAAFSPAVRAGME